MLRDIISLYAHVERRGRTSLAIRIEVIATRDGGRTEERVTEGVFTFVALDENPTAEFLARYLGAAVGAVNVVDPEGFRRVAGYALGDAPDAHVGAVAAQAARERRALRLTNVPQGHLRIESATVSAAPAEVLVAPALADGRVEAVIELGFLRPVDAHDLELLDRSAESLGVAVRSATARFGAPYIADEASYAVAAHATLDAWQRDQAMQLGQPLPTNPQANTAPAFDCGPIHPMFGSTATPNAAIGQSEGGAPPIALSSEMGTPLPGQSTARSALLRRSRRFGKDSRPYRSGRKSLRRERTTAGLLPVNRIPWM